MRRAKPVQVVTQIKSLRFIHSKRVCIENLQNIQNIRTCHRLVLYNLLYPTTFCPASLRRIELVEFGSQHLPKGLSLTYVPNSFWLSTPSGLPSRRRSEYRAHSYPLAALSSDSMAPYKCRIITRLYSASPASYFLRIPRLQTKHCTCNPMTVISTAIGCLYFQQRRRDRE